MEVVEITSILGVLGRKTFSFTYLFFKLQVHTEHIEESRMKKIGPLPAWNLQSGGGGSHLCERCQEGSKQGHRSHRQGARRVVSGCV